MPLGKRVGCEIIPGSIVFMLFTSSVFSSLQHFNSPSQISGPLYYSSKTYKNKLTINSSILNAIKEAFLGLVPHGVVLQQGAFLCLSDVHSDEHKGAINHPCGCWVCSGWYSEAYTNTSLCCCSSSARRRSRSFHVRKVISWGWSSFGFTVVSAIL